MASFLAHCVFAQKREDSSVGTQKLHDSSIIIKLGQRGEKRNCLLFFCLSLAPKIFLRGERKNFFPFCRKLRKKRDTAQKRDQKGNCFPFSSLSSVSEPRFAMAVDHPQEMDARSHLAWFGGSRMVVGRTNVLYLTVPSPIFLPPLFSLVLSGGGEEKKKGLVILGATPPPQ